MASTDYVTKDENSPFQTATRIQTRFVAGFAGDASVAVAGLSSARGDKLVYVGTLEHGSGTASVNVLPGNLPSVSVSISADRVVVADTATTDKVLIVTWWTGDSAN